MDFGLQRAQEARIEECRKVLKYINLVDFVSLDDKEIRTLMMIREISSGIVNSQRKLATETDVSRVLKTSIDCMVGACKKVVDQISRMHFQDLNEQEKKSIKSILKIARGIISRQGVVEARRHGDLSQAQEDEVGVGLAGGEREIQVCPSEQHPQASTNSISLAQQSDLAAPSFGADFVPVGIANSPSPIISLADDIGNNQLVQILEDSELEPLHLPPDLQEPHKSNYEHLFSLIGNLKDEIRKKDDQLKEYERKLDLQSSYTLWEEAPGEATSSPVPLLGTTTSVKSEECEAHGLMPVCEEDSEAPNEANKTAIFP